MIVGTDEKTAKQQHRSINNNQQQPTTTNNNQQQPTTTNNNQQQPTTTNNNQQQQYRYILESYHTIHTTGSSYLLAVCLFISIFLY